MLQWMLSVHLYSLPALEKGCLQRELSILITNRLIGGSAPSSTCTPRPMTLRSDLWSCPKILIITRQLRRRRRAGGNWCWIDRAYSENCVSLILSIESACFDGFDEISPKCRINFFLVRQKFAFLPFFRKYRMLNHCSLTYHQSELIGLSWRN